MAIIWDVKTQNEELVRRLSEECGLSSVVIKLLINRGFTAASSIKNFLFDKDEVISPELLPDMDKAVARIKTAFKNKERITVYGDYDVDGITAVCTVYCFLKQCGFDVDYYIPDREQGYGVNRTAIDKIKAAGSSLIITVDCGVTAFEEVVYASELGIDMIITDHHECKDTLPEAVAVVNPKRADSKYPFPEIAGVAVALSLVIASVRPERRKYAFESYCAFAALGTIADIMPLLSVNRTIVKYGLKQIEKTNNLGLLALMECAGISNRKKNATTIGFSIAPRLNAAGRMGDPSRAVELLITNDEEQAQIIANELCDENKRRQAVEENILNSAVEVIEESIDTSKTLGIVACGEGWHQGVLGIAASRLVEKYHLPTVCITVGDDMCKGSARSIPGFNIYKAFEYCKDVVCDYGGHALAAGISMKREQIHDFTEKFYEYCKNNITPDMLDTHYTVECALEGDDLSLDVAYEIGKLEPFGTNNPVPLFVVRNAVIDDLRFVGSGKHLRLSVKKSGKSITAMFFGMNEESFKFKTGDKVDIYCNIDISEYRGYENFQLIVKAIEKAGDMNG